MMIISGAGILRTGGLRHVGRADSAFENLRGQCLAMADRNGLGGIELDDGEAAPSHRTQ